MSTISPLAAITDWLGEQDEEIQQEVALTMTVLLLDGQSLLDGTDLQVAALLEWLTHEGDLKFFTVGRALRFKACFEFFAQDRFTHTGWRGTETMFRGIVSQNASDPKSDVAPMAPGAFKALRDLPERRDRWSSAGQSWAQLVEKHLTHEALNRWALQPIQSP